MTSHHAGSADELAIGERKLLNLDGTKVLLFHLDSGFHAVQASCPHLMLPLKNGKLMDGGKTLQCPIHRAQFDIATGGVNKWANFPPGIQMLNVIRKEKCLQTYTVTVADNELNIEI
ncbi:MAG: non-heme iron oxygenase ferredoxin subunit [Gammaproteobacteria bacterium]|nr:MAG: non-heme iron oxygenase ferredoxin subunit [Gammaproteobacteria bacterium]